MSHHEEEIEALRKRIQLVEDREAIARTQYGYAHYLDYGLIEQWVDLFTEDAVYRRAPRPGVSVLDSRAELRDFATQHAKLPQTHSKHMNVEPMIELNGDEATVLSYFVRFDEKDGKPFVNSFGRYHDHMVRCADGRWRIKERRIERDAAVAIP